MTLEDFAALCRETGDSEEGALALPRSVWLEVADAIDRAIACALFATPGPVGPFIGEVMTPGQISAWARAHGGETEGAEDCLHKQSQ